MIPNRRPIGVWITTVYLFVLLALGVLYLFLAIDAANARFVLHQSAGVLVVLSAVLLLVLLSRWAVPMIGILAALQASTYLSNLMADGSTFIALQASDAAMRTFLIANNWGPLALLAATLGALLYSLWSWRTGILT